MPERPAAGRAVVTRRAVTDIVRTAVLGCYGVAGFATPTPLGHVVRWLGLGEPGIRVVLDDLRIALHIRVAYGLPIAEVARQVESAVRYALGRDLGREPGEVSIHVDGLVQREGSVPTAAGTVAPSEPAVEPAGTGPVASDALESPDRAADSDPGADLDRGADLDPVADRLPGAEAPPRATDLAEQGGRL